MCVVTFDGRETVLSTLETASSLSVEMGEREEVSAKVTLCAPDVLCVGAFG